MALKTTIIGDNGAVSTYHRIADIQQNFINSVPTVIIYMYHYADSSYRDIEKVKIETNNESQTIIGSSRYELKLDESKGGTRKDFYNRLVEEIEDFKNAEKC